MHQQMAHAGPKASRRDWIGLAVIAIPCLIYSMDLTVLYLAVPQISADLKPSSSGLLWTATDPFINSQKRDTRARARSSASMR